MTEDFIEWYDTFNTKGCPEDLIFGRFNDQPIPSNYSYITNYYDDDGTQIYSAITDSKGVEDSIATNDENKNDDSLASYIDPPLKHILETKGAGIIGNET